MTTKEQRIVAVPIPSRVQLRVHPRPLPKRELEATNLTDYLAAQSALEYGRAALRYVADCYKALARYAGAAWRGLQWSLSERLLATQWQCLRPQAHDTGGVA